MCSVVEISQLVLLCTPVLSMLASENYLVESENFFMIPLIRCAARDGLTHTQSMQGAPPPQIIVT